MKEREQKTRWGTGSHFRHGFRRAGWHGALVIWFLCSLNHYGQFNCSLSGPALVLCWHGDIFGWCPVGELLWLFCYTERCCKLILVHSTLSLTKFFLGFTNWTKSCSKKHASLNENANIPTYWSTKICFVPFIILTTNI